MAIVRCGIPLTSASVVSEINTGCDILVPATPCGIQNEATPCEENHTLEIVTTEYAAALKTSNQWVVPGCNQTAPVVVPGLKLAHIGSFIWSVNYGAFLVTAFNPGTHTLTVRNLCTVGNKSPGTVVPTCSIFIVRPPPCISGNTQVSYLTTNFVVPAIGNCVTIQVTDTSDLSVGFDINIGISQFTISQIISDTALQVCNLGVGGSVGSTITALNGGGQYQYPLIVSNSSKVFDEEKSIGPTSISTGQLTRVLTLSDSSQNISYVNPSTDKAAQILYTIQASINGLATSAHTSVFSYKLALKQKLNGGVFVTVIEEGASAYAAIDDTGIPESKEVSWDGVASVAPGDTFTLDAQAIVTNTGSGGAGFSIDNFSLSVVGLVVVS